MPSSTPEAWLKKNILNYTFIVGMELFGRRIATVEIHTLQRIRNRRR